MPIVNIAQREENEKDEAQQGQPAPANFQLRQNAGNQSPSNNNSLTTVTSPSSAPQGSGNFTNLRQYLEANRAGAANLGNRVGGAVNEGVNKASSEINQAGSQFKQNVDSGTNRFNEGLVNEATSDARSFINNPDKVNQLQKQKSGSFGGPDQFIGTEQATKALGAKADAEETANLTKTVGGRQELIRSTNKSNPYSQGGLSLNQFLLQNNQGALDTVSNAAKTADRLGGEFDQTKATSDAAAQLGKQISNETGTRTNQRLTGAVGDFRTKLGEKATSQSEAEAAEQARIAQELGANTPQNRVSAFSAASAPTQFPDVSDDTLAKIGLTREQFDQLKQLNSEVVGSGREGISLGNYLQNTRGQFTEGLVASPEEQAEFAALNQLAGTGQSLNSGGFRGNSEFDLQNALNALLSQTGGGTFNPETGEVTNPDGSVAGGVGGLTGIGTVARIIKEIIERQRAEREAAEQAERDRQAAEQAERDRQAAEEAARQNQPVQTQPVPDQPAVDISPVLGGVGGAVGGGLANPVTPTPGGTTTITEGPNLDTPANQQPNQNQPQQELPQNNSQTGSVGGSGSGVGLGGALAGGVGAAAGTLAGAAPAGTVLITEGAGQIANQIAQSAASQLGTGAAGAATGAQTAAAGEAALGGSSYAGAARAVGNALAVVGAAYGAYSTYQAAAVGDTKNAIISGASTGAAIGSVVPGIGTLVGAAIGAVVGGIGSLFGSKPKASQIAYAAYKKLPVEANIRGFTIPQMSSGYFESFKAHKNSGKFPILNDLYSALGASQGDHKTASSKMLGFLEGIIETAQKSGGLPDDNSIVRQLDGQRIYAMLGRPAIDALIAEKLGKPGYDNFTTQDNYGKIFPGGFDQYTQDAFDWMISQWGLNKTSTNDYAAGRNYVNPAFAPPPPAPAQPVYTPPYREEIGYQPSTGGRRILSRQLY